MGISKRLLQTLQLDLSGYLNALAGPQLPLNPFTAAIIDKWTHTLVRFQYSPGIQGFLDYFLPGGSNIQDKMLKAACTIYPWTKSLPPPVRTLKDSYCVKAIPADVLSKITQGIKLPGALPLPGPGLGGPLPGPL